jgi:tRNA(Arg) A34 adenosine deaminase TadA
VTATSGRRQPAPGGRGGAAERLARIHPRWLDAFDLAWESWCAGSLGIGAVLLDTRGEVVSRGRNRVLEQPSSGRLAGSLLAHAEMDAFSGLGLGTGEGMTLLTTVQPCLMCSATAIAMRTARVSFAASDPVFEGLDATLGSHAYCRQRLPASDQLADPVLVAFAGLLPLAHRVWSRPGQPPRREWLETHHAIWQCAQRLVGDGTLGDLQRAGASVVEAIDACRSSTTATSKNGRRARACCDNAMPSM